MASRESWRQENGGCDGGRVSGVSVTIDGPAGSGKSTTARLVAGKLGYRYIDSGALYRAIAWKALGAGVDAEDSRALGALARQTDVELRMEGAGVRVWVDGRDVTEPLRRPQVTRAASAIARDPGVRDALTPLQRRMARRGGVVLEGRDSGTVVLPDAEVKVYLTASLATRAERRRLELAAAGVEVSAGQVERDLAQRDAQDSGRAHAPLRKPEGAVEIDTTRLSVDEQVELVVAAVRRASGASGALSAAARMRRGTAAMRPRYGFFWRLLNVLAIVLMGFRVLGRENVPFPHGCIVACNHVSFWDPPIVGMAIPREVHFLAKRQLFRNRIFGWLISCFNAIPIDRDRMDRMALRRCQDLLRSDHAVLIFPEGTRQKSRQLGQALPGVGALALATGVPVIPAYVSGTQAFWRNVIRRGRLSVRFGKPLAGEGAPGQSSGARARALTERVMGAIARLRDESLGCG